MSNPICTPINKEAILKRFQANSKPNSSILQLIEALPEVFSKAALTPENSIPGYKVPDSRDLFATAISNTRQPNTFVNKPKTVPKSPFSSSGLVENPEAKVWFYVDEEGNSQGPFATHQMDEWYDHKFFENDLQIRRAGQDNFGKLIDVLVRSENTMGRTFQKQGQYGQNKPQYRSGNEGGWDRGKNFNRNTQADNKTTSTTSFTRNAAEGRTASDKQEEKLSISRNQSENKPSDKQEEKLSISRNQSENKPKEQEKEEPIIFKTQQEAPKQTIEQKPVEPVKVEETPVPEEPKKVEEPVKEEEKVEEAAPAETSEQPAEEPEQPKNASLTENPREFISDDWKITIKKKKGKKGKNDEAEEEPVRLPVNTRVEEKAQPKVQAKQEKEAQSPTKASEQPKKKIIGAWGAEESKRVVEKKEKAPVEDFPSLESTAQTFAPIKVEAPKKQAQKAVPEQATKSKPVQAQEKPKAVPEQKKQTIPEVSDFPTLSTGGNFQAEPKSQQQAKKGPKTQFKQFVEPAKPVNKAFTENTAAAKEKASGNPKYTNDFPSL